MPAHHRKFKLPVLSRLTLAWYIFLSGTAALMSFAFFGGDMRPHQIALAVDGNIERMAQAEPMKQRVSTPVPERLEVPGMVSVLADAIPNNPADLTNGLTLAAAHALNDRVNNEPFSVDAEDTFGHHTYVATTGMYADDSVDNNGEVVILVDGEPAKPIRSPQDYKNGVIPAAPVTLAAIDQSLLRKSSFGPVPKISTDGRKPLDLYARPFKPAEKGNVALIIGGLGLNKAVTERAIDDLPGEITLAFAPYAKDLEYWAKRARDAGHEVMLELPMEHRSGDQSALGPAALLTSRTREENLQRLDWLLSRFEGYFGVTNYLGSRFSLDEKSISAVLTRIHGAGLAYVDDTGGIRRFGDMESRGASTVNRIIEPGFNEKQETARDFKALEEIALSRGDSLGKTYASASTIDEIAGWANGLRERNITLAPASAVLALRRGDL